MFSIQILPMIIIFSNFKNSRNTWLFLPNIPYSKEKPNTTMNVDSSMFTLTFTNQLGFIIPEHR